MAIGVSGGKDSSAVAFAVSAHLREIGHRGSLVLVHADLGRIEWRQSLLTCQRLAERLGLELLVVRRSAGDLLTRWHQRWNNNVRRYGDLECVKLILPWSTASMRFCTSELKTRVIQRELVKRFAGQTLLSVTGVRREESVARSTVQTVVRQPLFSSATHLTAGFDWHPIAHWNRSDVFDYLARQGFELHDAYRLYGSSRVSCAFCILAARQDLYAAVRCPDNHDIYRALVALEVDSTFSFQERQWLCDVAPHLLEESVWRRALDAKAQAARRESAERTIPKGLLYERGWPTRVPTVAEADLLAGIRAEVASAVGIPIRYSCADSIRARYAELLAWKQKKGTTNHEPAMEERPGLLSSA
ncbi:MAG: phosphoadenosine phosphosulfate reductase family protein [Chloroflexi bacterium]|nr:phosphoadenosine phosphosulfate reductase family protein [Chloroflexota bacterium]